MKATRTVLEIFKMAGYFPDNPLRISLNRTRMKEQSLKRDRRTSEPKVKLLPTITN